MPSRNLIYDLGAWIEGEGFVLGFVDSSYKLWICVSITRSVYTEWKGMALFGLFWVYVRLLQKLISAVAFVGASGGSGGASGGGVVGGGGDDQQTSCLSSTGG